MDLHKIIISAIDISVKEVLEQTDNVDCLSPALDQVANREDIETYKALMRYSNILLKSYHTELQKELAKHGIAI